MLGVDYRAMYEVHMRVTRRKYTRLLSLAASVVFLIFGLVMLALSADRKAQIQTIEAEGLANFIYSDILKKSAGYVPVSRRKIISEKLFEYYRRWQDDDATSVYSRANVLQEIGENAATMGEAADVVFGYSQSALELAERLYATDPTNRAYFDFYYGVLWKTAKTYDSFPNEERLEKSAQYYRRAIELCAGFRDFYPESPALWESDVAHSFKAYAENRLSVQTYRKQQELNKVREYQMAKEDDKAKEALAAIRTEKMETKMEKYAEAEDFLQKARQAYETMERRRPERFLAADVRHILYELYHDFANLYGNTDRYEQAVEWMRRSVETVRQLHQEDKNTEVPGCRSGMNSLR
jgi:tetratricopeptide (TPR) repeat protein